jgi:hypothetical protein
MNNDLQTAFNYVLASRQYGNVYIRKDDHELFARYIIELPYVGGMGVVVASAKPFGRSKTKSKCYLHWEDHPYKPERNGKPVSSVTIKAVLENLINNNNAYEL